MSWFWLSHMTFKYSRSYNVTYKAEKRIFWEDCDKVRVAHVYQRFLHSPVANFSLSVPGGLLAFPCALLYFTIFFWHNERGSKRSRGFGTGQSATAPELLLWLTLWHPHRDYCTTDKSIFIRRKLKGHFWRAKLPRHCVHNRQHTAGVPLWVGVVIS